jgi:hypothetical protein
MDNENVEITDEEQIANYWNEFKLAVKCEPSEVANEFAKFLKEKYDLDLVVEEE